MNPRNYFADSYDMDFGLQWIPLLPREQVDSWEVERILKYKQARDFAEENARKNPVGMGWTLPMWPKVMANWKKYSVHVILGGNRSTKSSFCSRLAVKAACTIPQAEIRSYQVNKEKSIDEQQRYIWEAIPIGIKNLQAKKGQNHSLQYSQKNGFTDNVCIFPPLPGYQRGGYIRFANYAQYADDPNTAESFKTHLAWLDEECPVALFDTLLYRTIDFHGRIILSFTTIGGWSPLVQKILGRTRTLEKRFAPLLGRELPIVQESLSNPDTCIYYFWTEDNAFIDANDFITKIKGKPKDEILSRAYGIPTKSVSGVFPGFNQEINVVKHEDMPFIKDREYPVTRYMAIDPGGSKNWFMVWVAIDARGAWWVYREWPDYDDWALPGATIEGKAGPAQKGTKKGIREYVEMIRVMESGEEIYERYIDPRMGAAQRQSEEGATTIISDLDEAGMTVIPAPGVDIENGIQLLQNLLAWDENKKSDSVNSPRFYVSDRCSNIIYAMAEYTAKGGKDEATKDAVDALRYVAVSNPEFYESKDFEPQGKTFSY